ncbi:MAG: metallophosphoesterase, partial [Firmicutes bacterium]|nr:metallophosphoesterase [Bacillota bacterium]
MRNNLRQTHLRTFAAALTLMFVLAVFALPVFMQARNAAAAGSAAPQAITVTYYDGVYTRGWTWRTSDAITVGEVQIIEQTGSLNKTNVNWTDSAVFSVAATRVGALDGYSVFKAQYDFGSAAHGKTFLYRVGAPGGWSDAGAQKIDDGRDGVKLLNLTDPQPATENNSSNWAAVLGYARNQMPDMQGVIVCGDFVDIGNDIDQWNWIFDKPKAILADTVLTPATGNHDANTNYFSSHFNIKTPTGANLSNGMYYSYDIGNVHIAVLNTNDIVGGGALSAAQMTWLHSDLAGSDADWKIIALHMGIITTHSRVSDADTTARRNQLIPLMAQYKVDLVLQGHDHIYVRSNPYSYAAGANGLTPSAGCDVITETFNGASRDFMVSPDGTTYLTV